MPYPVLKTKLYPPPARPYLVARSRLVDRMNGGLQAGRQLTLISAAAGFGKTTLTGEWIAESHLDGTAAWVSLDAEDNNPNRFLFYLIAALQQLDPEFGRDILLVMQSSQAAPLRELAIQLINQLTVSEIPVLLILDDYHLIKSEAVHQIVQLIIERQPSQMHTVILTREDPPLPIPRMRVRGQVTEVRERDLRFTLPEAETFLVEAMGLELSSVDVEKLKDRTEGWPAGMQLAALALEEYTGDAERRAFIDAFTGSDRYIVDYLVSEVLERQPEHVRDFLMAASILEQFCGDLCDHVIYGPAEAGKSQQILTGLEQGNMFLVPLDNQRSWYRFHHLFAEMLFHYLQRSSPDRVPHLYRRASQWYEARGDASAAVKYALATGDWDYAAALLERHAMPMILQGQGSLVIGWCRALPKAFLEESPVVCIYYAWALVLTFRNDYLDAVEEMLKMAERAIAAPDCTASVPMGQGKALFPLRNWVVGHACVIRSQILLGHFHMYVDPDELIALSLRGLELLPEAENAVRAICKVNLAHAQLIRNDPIKAQEAFDESLPFMIAASNYLGGVTCIFYQARLAYYLGQLEQAEHLCLHWKEKFAEMACQFGQEIPALRGLDIVLSILMVERGRFAEAETLLAQALDLPGWGSWMELLGYLGLVRLRCLRGDFTGAEDALHRMLSLGPQHANCAEALHLLLQTQLRPDDPQVRASAEAWVKSTPPALNTPFALGIGPYHCDVEYFCNLAWAQLQVYLGRPREALTFVQPALTCAKDRRLPHRILELTIFLASLYERLGESHLAAAELSNALEIAESNGYMRIFYEIQGIDHLLHKAVERGHRSAFARRLLVDIEQLAGQNGSARRSEQKEPQLSGDGEVLRLIAPLSEREAEVLRLIAGGLSNIQIAERLYIAQGTVKRHITNLYSKLDVQTRTQALAKARKIGLLS